ncbi:MAG: hypothetical protein HXX13_11060 [Bacteroidetes bacterium]|nr:hypothetical protein [Bacteroidota bacterium]
MKQVIFTATILFSLFTGPVISQNSANRWEKWEYLVGEWKGEGTGKPGEGIGTFSINKDLSDKILVKKGHTEFPPIGLEAGYNHDDLMIVSLDFNGNPNQSIYFDNEGHTIHYAIVYTENEIVFTSEAIPNLPRFQLKYQKLGEKKVNIIFAIASPQSPEEFKTYIEGKSNKIE